MVLEPTQHRSPPRVSLPPPTQENASMDITLTFSPITLLDVQFDTPSPSPPFIEHTIPCDFLWKQMLDLGDLRIALDGDDDVLDVTSLVSRLICVLGLREEGSESVGPIRRIQGIVTAYEWYGMETRLHVLQFQTACL
ncbi:hypothetical protein Tco_0422829 [Tanacetum coccineum]